MTNTPVKDVKSLMNFVGGNSSLKKAGGMDQMGNFGDVMSKTQGGLVNSQMQSAKNSKTMQIRAADMTRSRREVVNATETAVKETAAREDMTTEQNQQALEQAGEEIAKEVAKELDVTEEEVAEAMEEMGLSAVDLLNSSNLTQLVLQLSGEQDNMALLTDESLFSQLQNLLDFVSEVKGGLMESLDVTPQELQVLVDEMLSAGGQLEAGELTTEAEAATAEEPVITVEVKAGDDTVKLAADENGNAIKTVEVVSPNMEENVARENTGGQEQKSSENNKQGMEENFGSANQLLDVLNQNNANTTEVSFEQTVPVFSEQTQDIMDQIMDYMKINLKPDTQTMELQLHPASLGTLNVQIMAKDGGLTAHFTTQNEAVRAVIETQLIQLKSQFEEQGIKVDAVEVTVANHAYGQQLSQENENAKQDQAKSGKGRRRINLDQLDGEEELEDLEDSERIAVEMMRANGNTVDYTA